jgi:predicted Co/Zn/Cd cation transporter (cation efflux family)
MRNKGTPKEPLLPDFPRITKWTWIGLWACRFSIVWNLIEGGSGVYFGLQARQLSLTTFGVQSLIEILSASLVLFRFNLDAKSEGGKVYDRERYGSRLIGVCLVLLAIFASVGAVMSLKAHEGPDASAYGIIVAGVSALAMALLWVLKIKAGTILKSSVMMSDAKCSLMCMCLGILVVLSSVVDLLIPKLWWVDSVCAIFLALRFIRDGVKIVHNTYREDFAGGCG